MMENKLSQKAFKQLKELNAKLRNYFNFYYYHNGFIYGKSTLPYAERFAIIEPFISPDFDELLVLPNKLFEQLKTVKQTKMEIVSNEKELSILSSIPETKMEIYASINKRSIEEVNPYTFYKYLIQPNGSMIDCHTIDSLDEQFRRLETEIIHQLVAAQSIDYTIENLLFVFTKELFPLISEDTSIGVMLSKYKEPGKRYIVFKEDYPKLNLQMYSCICVLDLQV